ncbi:hypothetical protein GCK32_017056, partial [Trichostrongylus colubriformis]
ITTDNVSTDFALSVAVVDLLVSMVTEGWRVIARNTTNAYTVRGWNDPAHQERCSTNDCRSVTMLETFQSVAVNENCCDCENVTTVNLINA